MREGGKEGGRERGRERGREGGREGRVWSFWMSYTRIPSHAVQQTQLPRHGSLIIGVIL